VLRFFLLLANALNVGTAAAGAKGFALESLATLCGTKSVDGKTTLLEVVFEHFGAATVGEMAASFEYLATAVLPAAAGNPVPATSTLISTIANSLQRLKKVASQAAHQQEQQQHEEDRLVSLMKQAHDRYEAPTADLVYRLNEVKDKVVAALEFLGESRDDDAAVFNTLLAFCREFGKAKAAWFRKAEVAEKARAKKEADERKAAAAAASSSSSSVDAAVAPATTASACSSPKGGDEVSDARAALRASPRPEKKNSDAEQQPAQRSAEAGWESTTGPAALFSRVPPRSVVADDDDW
jgi:hypothetical protein